MKTERRYLPGTTTVETRDDGSKVIAGHAAVFADGSPDTEFRLGKLADGREYIEHVMPEAFTGTAEDRNIVGLFNHDRNLVLGRNGGSMVLSVDQRGLRYEIPVDPEDPDHARILRKIERGDVTGSSFSFAPNEGGVTRRVEDGRLIRELRSLRVFDVGPVTFPAYAGTSAEVSRRDAEPAWQEAADVKPPVVTTTPEQVRNRLRVLDIIEDAR